MTSLPALRDDVWRLATAEEKTFWLGLLSTLRSSTAAEPEDQVRAFDIVLDGVSFYGMSEAIKLIIKGRAGLNPSFAPNPAQLGEIIDRVMRPSVEVRAREAQQRKRFLWDEDKGRDRKALVADARTPEAQERAAALLSDAHLPPTRHEITEQRLIAYRASVRSAHGLTDARLAAIPDRPDIMPRARSPLLLAPPTDPSAALELPAPPTDEERCAGLEIVGGAVKITDALHRLLVKKGQASGPMRQPAPSRSRRRTARREAAR